MLAIASVVLVGCQQQPATTTTPAGDQTASTTATVKIEQPTPTATSTGTLQILPAQGEVTTKVESTGTLDIKAGEQVKDAAGEDTTATSTGTVEIQPVTTPVVPTPPAPPLPPQAPIQ